MYFSLSKSNRRHDDRKTSKRKSESSQEGRSKHRKRKEDRRKHSSERKKGKNSKKRLSSSEDSDNSSNDSDSSSSSDDSIKLLQKLKTERIKALEEKKKQKEMLKANETPEEKRFVNFLCNFCSTSHILDYDV